MSQQKSNEDAHRELLEAGEKMRRKVMVSLSVVASLQEYLCTYHECNQGDDYVDRNLQPVCFIWEYHEE